MKKTIHFTYILFLLISCNKELNTQPKYSDFDTHLEIKNLFGNVKQFSQYRANIIDSNKYKTEKKVINLKEEFTKNGFVKSTEYFDVFGKTIQTTENFYDTNDYLLKITSKGENYPQKMIKLIARDTIKKTEHHDITINDTLNYQLHAIFGKLDKIEKQIKVKNGDSTTVNYKHKFDSNNKVTQIEEINDNNKTVSQYKYDANGNLKESINDIGSFKFKEIRSYKNNKITKIENYNVLKDLKQDLESITEFDDYYNPINEKTYQSSKLNRETKNEYEFDDFGNWIKKTVYLKEHFANSKKFVPIYIETRKISYWK